MCVRSTAVPSLAVLALCAIAPSCLRAEGGGAAPAGGARAASPAPQGPPVKRALATLDKVAGATVHLHTADGAALKVFALHRPLILLKQKFRADADDFTPGDKVVIYYSAPRLLYPKVLLAAADLESEAVLAELRREPIKATFESFDARTSKLTVRQGGRAKAYTMAAPLWVMREGDQAALGKPAGNEQKGYDRGDSLLLVMTWDRKQVRVAMDQATYDSYGKGMKSWPIPPPPKGAKRR